MYTCIPEAVEASGPWQAFWVIPWKAEMGTVQPVTPTGPPAVMGQRPSHLPMELP